MTRFSTVVHPRLGALSVWWDIEEHWSPGNGWDDPGDPCVISIERIYNTDETIRWYLPHDESKMETEIDQLVHDTGAPYEYDDDPDW